MSKLYFYSQSGDAEVYGTERHWFNWLCHKMLLAILDLGSDTESRPHPLRQAFPANHYTTHYYGKEWATNAENAIIAGGISDPDFRLTIGDRKSDFWTAALNTALAIGGDPLKLAARLHGQCELHAFVEGTNRAWLADIIEAGRQRNIFRANTGWESVIELLRSSSEGPVVTSYSVCEQFPNEVIAVEEGVWSPPETANEDEDDDAWYGLPETEQWRFAMDALRIRNQAHDYKIELKPDDWADYHFGDGVSAFDIVAHFNSLAESHSG
ncbi:MAG: hypothetical protein HYT40_04035 [Candidatus Sungbacteria bacterium]|uniref:Uncharacterized protein n=1 Tax=Candidatus Sungiibacteriota bacterium TaxID=2750080 RepID=A0A931SE31_9BACT|nr:hypothetical protein [Candidatus Sungbacteria bacterium]